MRGTHPTCVYMHEYTYACTPVHIGRSKHRPSAGDHRLQDGDGHHATLAVPVREGEPPCSWHTAQGQEPKAVMHVRTYTRTHTRMPTCSHAFVYVYACTYMPHSCVNACICIYIGMHAFVLKCARMYVLKICMSSPSRSTVCLHNVYMHVYVYTCLHACLYMRMRMDMLIDMHRDMHRDMSTHRVGKIAEIHCEEIGRLLS